VFLTEFSSLYDRERLSVKKRETEFEGIDAIEQHKVKPPNNSANLLDVNAK